MIHLHIIGYFINKNPLNVSMLVYLYQPQIYGFVKNVVIS